ncbi:MAG: 2-succinyl-5-enolpyruvyl-6-hydroxy-3-cyclohexene-1-carboxylic-acid synthase [Chlamydiia bacterium]|nr:2-succinyl-5-enolpyruvyl-6-hydroxy-3-cyclohexene-1-carboxylic-acid synthase [Chlamydiia bacterium]
MNDDQGAINERWAYQIVDLFIQQGIDYFCIAPGSRSSPLILAAANHPRSKTFIHYDERGLGFHALGYAKACQTAAVVIVTSGTAVGNLMPAVMEARASHLPIIILSADRPPELRDCGANQTINQVNLFDSFVKWQIDLPCPSPDLPERFLSSTLSYAGFITHDLPAGPVQINCMLREPLHTKDLHFPIPAPQEITYYHKTINTLSDKDLVSLSQRLSRYESGMIFVGSLNSASDAKAILDLAQALHWPVACDITSSIRSHPHHELVIPYFELIAQSQRIQPIDCILHFGDRNVSKTISQWLSVQQADYLLVAEHTDRFDPKYRIDTRYTCNISWLCNALIPLIQPATSTLSSKLLDHSHQIIDLLDQDIFYQDWISEPYLFHFLSQTMPDDWDLFIGNSMPVRDADTFFYPKGFRGHIFVNRGVSGIDGNLSTAAGIAACLEHPLVVVVGDLTFMHDMNALEQIAQNKTPIILIVINNGGGGIFSFLPIKKKEKEFETFIATKHTRSFEALASFVELDIFYPDNTQALDLIWSELCKKPRTCMIELHTDRENNVALHAEIIEKVKQKCCPLTPTGLLPIPH